MNEYAVVAAVVPCAFLALTNASAYMFNRRDISNDVPDFLIGHNYS